MSAGFTPGPWDADWWYWVIRDLHNQPAFERGEKDGHGYPGFDGDNTANANLIAAAPDLYEALDEVRVHIAADIENEERRDEPNEQRLALFKRRLAMADTALARARGES